MKVHCVKYSLFISLLLLVLCPEWSPFVCECAFSLNTSRHQNRHHLSIPSWPPYLSHFWWNNATVSQSLTRPQLVPGTWQRVLCKHKCQCKWGTVKWASTSPHLNLVWSGRQLSEVRRVFLTELEGPALLVVCFWFFLHLLSLLRVCLHFLATGTW